VTAAPARARLEQLLAAHAPLSPAPLCPEILAHQARSLVEIWEAAERLAGVAIDAPFWAYAWPGGCALARVLLDQPDLVRGRRVLDFGAGGGVSALAAARAGAAFVMANDIDPWASGVVEIAASAQNLLVVTSCDDICAMPELVDGFDVVLCGDLSYEREQAPRQRAVLERARLRAVVLVADAGRKYFEDSGLSLWAEYEVAVPLDLEGVEFRRARVYAMGTASGSSG
jgi:predicted nicotinamide N-methyase